MDAITVNDLTKFYRGPAHSKVCALDGVSLSVEKGAVFGLIGPNGAGKTTLVKILLGLVRPTSGSGTLFGKPVPSPQSRRGAGYLPENPQHPGYLTPRQLLALEAVLAGVPGEGRGAKGDALLERVGILDAAGRKTEGFSKGMRQRLGLACALVGSPDLLLLDEPTDGVDPVGRAEIRRIIEEESERGATIFINSHLLAEVERTCDTVAILSKGKVVREGRMADVVGTAGAWTVRLVAPETPGALPTDLIPEAGTDGLYRIDSSDLAQVNRALDAARAAGYLVSGLAPQRSDLEKALLLALGRPS